MEFTGERYITKTNNAQISYEHWHRYLLASSYVKGKKVLDAACGEGYGTNLLSKTAKEIIGIDNDELSIKYAKSKYSSSNTNFYLGNVEDIPIKGNRVFDIIISFETIEHIDEAGQMKFMNEIKRLLKSDGMLIISSPVKENYGKIINNPFHIKELSADEFSNMMLASFKCVKLLGQEYYTGSFINDLNKQSGKSQVFNIGATSKGFHPSTDLQKDQPTYLIALCSDLDLENSIDSSFLYDPEKKLAQNKFVELKVCGKDGDNRTLHLSKTKLIDLDTSSLFKLKFDLYDLYYKSDLVEVSIQLLDNIGLVNVRNISIYGEDDFVETDMEYKSTAQLTIGDYNLFTQKNNFLTISVKGQVFKSIILEVDYISIGPDLLVHLDGFIKNYIRVVDNKYHEKLKLLENTAQSNEILIKDKTETLAIVKQKLVAMQSEKTTEEEDLRKGYQDILNEIAFMKDTLKGKEYKEKVLYSFKERQEEDLVAIKEDIKSLSINLEAAKELNRGLETQIANNQERLILIQTTIKSKEDSIDHLGKQLDKAKEQFRDSQELIKVKEDSIDHLGKQLDKAKEYLISVQQEKDEIIETQHHEIQKFKNDYQDQINSYGDLKNSLSTKIGWTITAPIRAMYNLFSSKDSSKNKTWVWLQIVKAGLLSPFALMKNLNRDNYRILMLALRREPPQLIVKNLYKKLQGKNATATNLSTIPKVTPVKALAPVISNSVNVRHTHSNKDKEKVLYISPHLPDFDTSSGGKRATRMLELMAEEFDVYAFTMGNKPPKYIDELSRRGVIVFDTTDYLQVKRKIASFKAIIYAWYYTYHESKRFVELYPDAKIIMDTVDVHWVREERSIGIWEGLTLEKVKDNKTREVGAYQNADVIWAVTEQDKQAVLKEIPTADVRVVSNIHEPVFSNYEDNKTNNILFIGGYNHYPNLSAIKKLALEILPKVRGEIKDAQLIIAGANAPEEVINLKNQPGVIYKGFIEEEDMDDLYKETFLTVSPLLAGAGIKGKICESIAYMTPVVTNSIGNEGINLIHEKEGLIGKSEEMPAFIIKAMKRGYNFKEMTTKAQDKLFQLVGSEGVKQQMVHSIFPEISICIVTWHRLELVKRCIESIEGNTTYPNYKILVYSNGCADGTQEYLKAAAKINKRIIPILSKDNEVFVIPNNKMMKMFPENDVVLVNNDVYVTKNWLTELYKTAYSSKTYGVVGSKLLYPDGTLQEFGSELYADGTGRNIGKWEDPDQEAYKKLAEVGYVSGCSMYIKRSTINRIGVFDELFHPCYCEDSDYCYTAKEHGLKTVVTPNSVVYHDEGGTSGTDTSSGMKKYQVINMEKFLKKHQGKDNGINWTN